MDDQRSSSPPDQRLAGILARLAEIEDLVERLPEPERTKLQDVVIRIRRELQPIIDALSTRH